MIWGRRGNLSEASRLFNLYYQNALTKYNYEFENGIQEYLQKGQSIGYKSTKTNKFETITATKSGYITIFSANRGHLDYLEKLAKELGIEILYRLIAVHMLIHLINKALRIFNYNAIHTKTTHHIQILHHIDEICT